MALAALLLMAPHRAVAQQAVTVGQLMANGFEVRASYMVEKGTPVLVLQKGADAYLCSPLQGDRYSNFRWPPSAGTPGRCRPCRRFAPS